MDTAEPFISGIHNYCDRWCERCEFTDRCHVFAMEAEAGLADSDDPMGDALRTVGQSLADAKRMLIEHAEEMGIDIDSAMHDPEIEEGIDRRRAAVDAQEPVELAKSYADKARHALESSSEWLAESDDPLADEMLEILHWHVFFIAAKLHRGYHGIIDLDGDEDTDELRDTQSDANGSIKIALIAIERSILAWTYLINPANSEMIRPLIENLETIKTLAARKFPNAREFVRPGFDEIETVM